MTRLSRLALATALVAGAACSGTPTEPKPVANTMAPDAEVLLNETDDCRGGFSVQNGKAC